MHDLITTHDAAEALGCSPATITRWVRNGRLTAAHQAPGPTGAYMFHRSYIEQLAAA